jgi:hypothetical protein
MMRLSRILLVGQFVDTNLVYGSKAEIENANGRLRHWLRRQTDIDKVPDAQPRALPGATSGAASISQENPANRHYLTPENAWASRLLSSDLQRDWPRRSNR